jgi:hypothetical protein
VTYNRVLGIDPTTDLPHPDVQTAMSKGVLSGKASIYTPEMYGAVGDGSADDETAVRAAFSAANAKLRAGVTGTIWHPGATVKLSGYYNLPNLTAPIDVQCNLQSDATLIAPTSYAGIVLRIGHSTSGSVLQAAKIDVPDVLKSGASAPPTGGSVGVQVINLYSSDLRFGRTAYFETGIQFTGLGNGTVYNRVHLGWVSYCKVSVSLTPGSGGWVNQNVFSGGGVQQSAGWAGGTRLSGWRHLVLDGAPGGTAINAINGNVFTGTSWEGDVSEFTAYIRHARRNKWIANRFEPGSASTSVTVSGDTLTTVAAHNLATGDQLMFAATSTPTGMVTGAPYFVVNVPSSTTYKVAKSTGGTAFTFSSAGSGVSHYRMVKIRVDNTNSAHSADANVFEDPMSFPQPVDIQPATTGNVSNVGSAVRTTDRMVYEGAAGDGIPIVAVRNAAANTAAIAAYAASVSPQTDPLNWVVALTGSGLMYALSGAEAVRVFTSSGASGSLRTRRPSEGNDYEIPQVLRTQGGALSITSLSCTANATTTTTLTLTNVAVGDTVVATPTTDLATGLILAWSRVSAANTVKLGFYNATGSTISLTTTVTLCEIRQFF